MPDGPDHAFNSPRPKTSRNQDSIECSELLLPLFTNQPFGLNPLQVDLGIVRQATVKQRFIETLIGIFQLDILPDDPDRHFALWVLDRIDQPLPGLDPAFRGG